MKDKSKIKRLVIRLTRKQQTDLKNALGLEKPCKFIQIPLPEGWKRYIDRDIEFPPDYPPYGLPAYAPPPPDFPESWDKGGTVKIID